MKHARFSVAEPGTTRPVFNTKFVPIECKLKTGGPVAKDGMREDIIRCSSDLHQSQRRIRVLANIGNIDRREPVGIERQKSWRECHGGGKRGNSNLKNHPRVQQLPPKAPNENQRQADSGRGQSSAGKADGLSSEPKQAIAN